MVDIRLLGRFSARRDGEEIPPTAFGGRLVRILVRLLVTRRGEFVSHDVLAEALWPGRLPADPVANLQVLVNRARRALRDPSLVVTGPGGYAFAVDGRCIVDGERFIGLVAEGREQFAAGHPVAALRTFREALERWGEPLAEDAYEDWAQAYRTRLARVHLQALEDGTTAALAARDPAGAVVLAEQAVEREPLREIAHLLLAQAFVASGDSVAAVRTIDGLRLRLADELGLDLSPEVRELDRHLLRGQPPGPVRTRPPAMPAPAGFFELPFVGRDRELGTILGAVHGARPGIVLLSGASGAGKSRLIAEVAARSSVPVLGARAFAPEREAAWSMARSALREALSLDLDVARVLAGRAASALARILPELDELRSPEQDVDVAVDAEGVRALALEAAVRLLESAASAGALLLADDLQWADATSLSLLSAALLRIPQLGAVLAYRPEEVGSDGPVASFLADLETQWARVTTLALPSLSREAIGELVVDQELVDVIVRATVATPLAVTEVVRTLAGHGDVERDPDGRWRARTHEAIGTAAEVARMGEVRSIAARVARQPASRRELLSLLALLGRETPARILATATKARQASVLDHLDGLTQAGLVRIGDAGWAPAHDLVGEMIVERLGGAQRGRMHEILARALTTERGDVSEVARHLAGAGDRAAAARAYADAARDRLQRVEAAEASRLADAGLGLDPDLTVRAALLEIRAEGRAILGDLDAARADLRAVLGMKRSGSERSRTMSRIAMLTLGDDFARAEELVEMALTEAGSDAGARAEALTVAAFVDVNTGRLDRVDTRSTEALALFEQLGDSRGAARILDARAGQRLFQGRIPEAADMYDRAARLYLDSGSLLQAGTPRGYRGWCLALMGRADEGLADVEEALELERTLGQTEGEAICLLYRGDALGALGRLDEARDSITAALATFRRLGVREQAANAQWMLGKVEEAAGNLHEAEAITREALETCPDMPFVFSMAASRLAALLVARGDLDGAVAFAQRAASEGIPFARYEADLARAEVAVLRGEPDADVRVAEALALAEAGRCAFSPIRRRLQEMSQR